MFSNPSASPPTTPSTSLRPIFILSIFSFYRLAEPGRSLLFAFCFAFRAQRAPVLLWYIYSDRYNLSTSRQTNYNNEARREEPPGAGCVDCYHDCSPWCGCFLPHALLWAVGHGEVNLNIAEAGSGLTARPPEPILLSAPERSLGTFITLSVVMDSTSP